MSFSLKRDTVVYRMNKLKYDTHRMSSLGFIPHKHGRNKALCTWKGKSLTRQTITITTLINSK